MRRAYSLAAIALAIALALAGCTNGGDDAGAPTPTTPTTEPPMEPTPTTPATTTPATPTVTTPMPVLDSTTYAIAVSGQPGQALPGAKFNFTMYVNGSVTHESDHIGAHYADNDTVNPPATGRKDCEHVTGELPGTYLVNCTIAQQGTWYVWGHARINDSGEMRNWWPATPFVVKVRDYNLTLSGAPTSPVTSKQNFTVVLNVTGMDNATANHIGVHYWNDTQQTPTLATAAGNCQHAGEPTGAIGEFRFTCAIENAGLATADYYVRGHLRLTEGATTLDWWSPEVKVDVLGIPSIA